MVATCRATKNKTKPPTFHVILVGEFSGILKISWVYENPSLNNWVGNVIPYRTQPTRGPEIFVAHVATTILHLQTPPPISRRSANCKWSDMDSGIPVEVG